MERDVTRYTLEAICTRLDRINKRLVIALVLAVLLIFASNALWLYAWTQYDYSSEEIVVDATDGIANYIGRDGDIANGTDYGTQTD